MAVNIKLPDGSVREYADGSSIEDVAASISSGLRKNAVSRQAGWYRGGLVHNTS